MHEESTQTTIEPAAIDRSSIFHYGAMYVMQKTALCAAWDIKKKMIIMWPISWAKYENLRADRGGSNEDSLINLWLWFISLSLSFCSDICRYQ